MDIEVKNTLLSAYNSYLDQCDNDELEPKDPLLAYEFVFLDGKQWRIPFADFMVEGDLRELTNLLNLWRQRLRSWHAWNVVIGQYDESDSWMLRYEFLDAIAHDCLLRPSSMRDTITSVATASLHQIRLSTDSAYKDSLETDLTSLTKQQKFPTKRIKEKQLRKISTYWPSGNAFIGELIKLDSQEYKKNTYDYRNLHSHTIGPRLGSGETKMVKRSIVEAEEMVANGDGTYQLKKIPDKLCVSYGFGGTPPLDLNQAHAHNLSEFKQARICYEKYVS